MLKPDQLFAQRYRVIRRLAEGGMGAVFECEHTGTEARVALKLLWPHVMEVDSAREKFIQEAKIAARVASDHIVQVLDAGFDEESRSPFLVMELLEGQTLGDAVIEGGPMDPGTVVHLMGQLAAGLDSAHAYCTARGEKSPIIHRDLKPENIFLSRRPGGKVQLKILDFGIAKVLSESTNVSQEVRGTPLYMAFEQVMASRLSPQTDIWPLGLITYFMLTGRRYWRSGNIEGAGMQSIFAEITTLPLKAPSARLREEKISARLPAGFDNWLLTCIDREPANRFASAGSAVKKLREALEGCQSLEFASSAKLASGSTATFQHASASSISVPGIVSDSERVVTSRATRGKWLPLAISSVALLTLVGALLVLRSRSTETAEAARPAATLAQKPKTPAPTPPKARKKATSSPIETKPRDGELSAPVGVKTVSQAKNDDSTVTAVVTPFVDPKKKVTHGHSPTKTPGEKRTKTSTSVPPGAARTIPSALERRRTRQKAVEPTRPVKPTVTPSGRVTNTTKVSGQTKPNPIPAKPSKNAYDMR